MIVIIDYDLGNLRSVQKAFERIDHQATISRDKEVLKKADKLVLPGVGHFALGMMKLKEYGLVELLNHLVLEKGVPILGICLGMQLMTNFSEEGMVHGLGWINADTVLFQKESLPTHLKIPHMGWNTINGMKGHIILKDISNDDQFYFVHSYSVKCHEKENSLSTTTYGNVFDSGIVKENIIGVQFHPEKSHKAGLQLIKNFVNFK